MDDRERDLALLKIFCIGKWIIGGRVIGIGLCTIVIIVMAIWSLILGSLSLILGAMLSCMTLMLLLIQYFVAGPLFREVKRLRDEIDSLKTEKGTTDPDVHRD